MRAPFARCRAYRPRLTIEFIADAHSCILAEDRTARRSCSTLDGTDTEFAPAVGTQWIEFRFGCGYHSGTVTDALQEIRTGEVIVAAAGPDGGGSMIVDLNSPTGTRDLCRPLQVPTYGRIVPDGRFAVADAI